MTHRTLIAAVIVVLAAATASGQVFSLINQSVSNITGTGARAHGMGGAFIALADDATAASWNPAGLSQLSRPEFSIVYEQFSGDYDTMALFVEDYGDFEPFPFTIESSTNSPGDFDDSNLTFASASYPFQVGKKTLVTQVSYRRMASFPDLERGGGRFAELLDPDGVPLAEFETVLDSNDEFSGGIDAYTISLATQLGGHVRIGLSANYVELDIRNHFEYVEVDVAAPEVCWDCRVFDAEESFSDWNFDIGLQWQPIRELTFGAVYHADFDADHDYRVTIQRSFYDPGSDQVIDLVPATSSGSTSVHFPDGWGAGVAWRPTERLTFAVDYSEMNWSEGRVEEYRSPGWTPDGTPGVGDPREIGFPFTVDQEDSWTARGGGEYVFMFSSGLIIPVRAGYFEEKQFAAFSEFVGAEDAPVFKGYSLGTGFAYKNIQFDIAWVHTTGDDSRTDFYTFPDTLFIDDEPYEVTVEVTENRTVDYSSDRYLASLIVRF
jgi:long-subunit fatty acid transport protein